MEFKMEGTSKNRNASGKNKDKIATSKHFNITSLKYFLKLKLIMECTMNNLTTKEITQIVNSEIKTKIGFPPNLRPI